jgi:hypothetical protein
MANIKISELTALTPPAAADELPVVDVSASATKKTTVGEVVGIITGDVEVASNGTATISELPVSKLQDGAARQLLQTDAAGTGVEWTSNIDIPGTLDVTGAATFDAAVSVALGSAASPSLTFTGDNNTGIYSPGADQVAIGTAGSGRLFVDASGNVGVGQSSPGNYNSVFQQIIGNTSRTNAGLAIGTSSSGSAWIGFNDAGDASIPGYIKYEHSTGSLQFQVNGSERLRINSAGLVGIGTSSPSELFQVGSSTNRGTVSVVGGGATTPYIKLDYSAAAGGKTYGLISGSSGFGNFDVYDFTGSAYRLTITSAGNVGIGTTSPGTSFHVGAGGAFSVPRGGGSSFTPQAAITSATGAAGISVGVDGPGQNGRSALFLDDTNGVWGLSHTWGTTPRPFVLMHDTNERLRVDTAGRLLVGASSDSGGALLQVNGNRIRIATAKTPASATDTGTAGEICWDADYIYVCTATNTWKRTAIATW